MSARGKAVVWSLVLAYSVVHFAASVLGYAWRIQGGDLLSAFPGPLMFRATEIWPGLAKDWIGPDLAWNYGPVLHLLTLPFVFASSRLEATRVILLFDYVLVVATFALWMRLLLPDRRYALAWIAVLCLWLNYFPLLEAITGRELEIFELFLITLGIWALRQQREVLAGLAFGVAAMTKFLPVVFISYLFVKGFRKGGWVAVGTVLSLAIFGQLTMGWQDSTTLAMVDQQQSGESFPTAYANQALSNVLYKTFTAFNINDPRPPTLYPHVLRIVGSVLSCVVVAATAWFVVRWRRDRFLELECALLAIVMCLIVPHANTYYFVFALPALSLGVAALYTQPTDLGRLPKAILFAAIALTGFLLPMKAFEIPTHISGRLIARALQGWSLPAYGAILAAVLMLALHRITREQHGARPAEVEWLSGSPLWLRVVIALAVPVAAFGLYLRFTSLQDVFCKSPDELAEMMPGLRLHALPIFNLHDPIRYNFVQSLFYSQHGLGDVSFYYLASGALSLVGFPVAERFLFAAGGVTNLGLALAGGIFGVWLLRSAGTGWIFAMLVLISPFYVSISRTGWGRLTWTPLLLIVLFLCQWKAMRDRGVGWAVAFVALAGFVSLTDGVVFLPLVGILALFVPDGTLGSRLRLLARDRIFLAAMVVILLGVGVDLAAGLVAIRRGADLTLMAYLVFKGSHSALIPSQAALAGVMNVVDQFIPIHGAWIVVAAAFGLAAVDGLRGRPIGFVAAWWLLAFAGVLRYASGLESAGRQAAPGWMNASILAVPTFLLVAWLIASLADGGLPFASRLPRTVRGVLAMAMLLLPMFLMARQAYTIAFATEGAFGLSKDQLTRAAPPGLNSCRVVKAAAFFIRSQEKQLPYVFHLSSDFYLGHIGEFYYGLSYGGSRRPDDPNHLLDFGLMQLSRKYPPEAFYRPYGVQHFDYYVEFGGHPDPLTNSSLERLAREGLKPVCNIMGDGRQIGRVFSFSGQQAIYIDYRTAEAGWDRTFGHARTLLLQPLAGTAYHFGYNWRPPE